MREMKKANDHVYLFWYFVNKLAPFRLLHFYPTNSNTHTHTHIHTHTHTHCIRLCPEGLSEEGGKKAEQDTETRMGNDHNGYGSK